MSWVYWCRRETSIGSLTVAASERGVCLLALPNEDVEVALNWLRSRFSADNIEERPQGLEEIFDQIDTYLEGNLKDFQLELDLRGTPFQIRIWKQLLDIPYGNTVTYASVAREVGNASGVRATGGAIGANPVALVVPCHRVIGSNGTLTGFGGGLPLKRHLLELEGILPRLGEGIEQWLVRRSLSPEKVVLGNPGTGIYCAPHCYHVVNMFKGNKIPRVFPGDVPALQAGFVPCKICKP
ncbi:MAG: methylated-DNA--[protein]-cysteine S-methyltransferase [Bacillota bacterium]